ncbi:amidohydrolase family protein [soil metagenome]
MHRKFTADHIFSGFNFLPDNKVLITDELGSIIHIADRRDAGDGIENFAGILCPGFINAHCHLELSYLKNTIPEKTGLVDFVQQVMQKRWVSAHNKLKAEEEKEALMITAVNEMYNTGIVAVGDICNTTDSLSVKLNSTINWHNFIEASGFVDNVAEKRLEDVAKVYDAFVKNGLIASTTFSPHAPYSVSKKLFEFLNNLTAKQLITIHNQETAAEDELYLYKSGDFLSLYKNFGIDNTGFSPTGLSSLQSWLPYFTKSQSIISVHNTFISGDDIAFAQDHAIQCGSNLFFCLCVNANMYIENKMPPIQLLMDYGAQIVVGTDSYASNWQLNILEEIKTIQSKTNNTISLEESLKWATSNGAKALQMDHLLGSFEKGKLPGIVLIENIKGLLLNPNSSARRIL